MDARFEIIDALVDGERVDAAALKRALAEEAGRDYLVDAWLLREGVQDEMASDASVLAAPRRARGARSWLFAAAAAVVCLVGGYFVGYRTGGEFRPGVNAGINASAPPPAAGARPATPAFPVPVPTRVIQVEFGADQTTGRGGD
jgi:hypothetical protein